MQFYCNFRRDGLIRVVDLRLHFLNGAKPIEIVIDFILLSFLVVITRRLPGQIADNIAGQFKKTNLSQIEVLFY